MSSLYFLATHFNNKTWEENQKFIEKQKTKQNLYDINCVYGTPYPIKNSIKLNSWILMCEMNNETDKIMGIGLLKNNNIFKRYGIYDEGNYNRYIYTGKYHLTREILESYDKELIERLDILLFKGKSHSKRGIGFSLVSTKKITEEIKLKIKNMFITHYKKSNKDI